ncbi:MAG: TaqI-like C-terminal specificity domain-containing protein, partial [Campylobacterota bacterium]|nr:TaqI-like C-terminal specificity domain-containing protein [Campylobacterota bacterium]
FDCVIGNPPYVGEKGNKEIFRPIKEIWNDRYEKNSDLLYFFFMKSIDILKENGNFGFITTNYFLTADSAVKLRKELKTRTAIYNLINFNEMKLFESALGQHNIITIFKKTTNVLDTNIINVISPDNITQEQLFKNSDEVEVFTVKSNELYDGDKNYIRVSKQGNSLENVFNKMTSKSKLMDEICFVNTGFNTGADRVTNSNLSKAYENIPHEIKLKSGIFVLTEDEYKKIKPEDKLVYKCYKSSDIEKYSSSIWQKLYVIWTNKDTNIELYPNIKNHLEKYRNFLELKREYHTGQLPWFSQHWAREYDVFGNTDKIVLPYRSKSNIFSYSNSDYFASKDILYLRQKDKNFNIKYILALLNSKLYYTWLYYKGKRKGETLELYVTPISQVPIKDISQKEQEPFINLVNIIIESKEKIAKYNKHFDSLNAVDKIEIKEEIEKLESLVLSSVDEIDSLVYELYGLSGDEIQIVEGN